jgi:hypothetical protein
MILKVKTLTLKKCAETLSFDNCTWTFYETERITTHSRPVLIENKNNLDQWSENSINRLNQIHHDDSDSIVQETKFPIKFNWLRFTDKKGITHTLLFDDEVYLLNDRGQTIEKIN